MIIFLISLNLIKKLITLFYILTHFFIIKYTYIKFVNLLTLFFISSSFFIYRKKIILSLFLFFFSNFCQYPTIFKYKTKIYYT